MRRLVLLSVGLLLLAFAGIAAAGPAAFKGKVKGGGTVDFKVKFKRGKPVQIVHAANPKPFGKGFTYTAIPVKCKQGKEQIFSQVPKALKVSKKRRFSYKLNLPQITPQGKYVNKIRISGRFVSKKKAAGTLRFQGAVYHAPSVLWTDCDSGVSRWTATR
jgi:hypothetical protein